MRERSARVLLRDALAELDRRPDAIAAARRCRGFGGGAAWMADRLRERGRRVPPFSARHLARLGVVKYGLCVAAALAWAAACVAVRWPWLAVLSPLAFYAAEAQTVFLFPAALCGAGRPFRDARVLTLRAGGTIAVMRTVLPIAAFMLLGGLTGRGVVRAWAAGCLAVVLWRERLPDADAEWFDPVDAFGLARLRLRTEVVPAGVAADLLLVSDLHLGRPWNRRLPRQVLRLARRTRPAAILLAGDLVDRPAGAAALSDLIRHLRAVAPVAALAGNHDRDPAALRRRVLDAGGHWLPDGPLSLAGVTVGTDGRPNPGRVGVRCVHRPADFDAAADGPRLSLAGHLHGGQCVLWRSRGRLLPAWLLGRWHVDRLDRDGRTFVVSRGAGDTLPVRWDCPREVVLCRLVVAGASASL